MKELSKEQMKNIVGGLAHPPIEGGDPFCNAYCFSKDNCGGTCKFCNSATGVEGPNGEKKLCSKIME